MKKLLFVTNNPHKLEEVKKAVKGKFEILSLNDIGFDGEIPETADTLEGNASLKSHFIFNKYGYDCFADDTGLEVEALDGRPGVFSARYAGEEHNHVKNLEKLLNELKDVSNRKARFRTIISLIMGGEEKFFEGVVKGRIIDEQRGKEGFGYDPVFLPDGYNKTFAEMNTEEKNKISHRGRAVEKLVEYLNSF